MMPRAKRPKIQPNETILIQIEEQETLFEVWKSLSQLLFAFFDHYQEKQYPYGVCTEIARWLISEALFYSPQLLPLPCLWQDLILRP